jgi:hypothetical protein
MTHVWVPELEAEFERLSRISGPGAPDVWLVLDAKTRGSAALAGRYPRCHVFDEAAISKLPYPRLHDRGLLNHPHFPVLEFFLAHPEYEHYWIVEYDVRYTGDWAHLLDYFRDPDHDLVTAHIRRFGDEPRWEWWESLSHPMHTIAREKRLRSFNVIYRMSHRALKFLHEAQVDGWRGHPEVSIATLLSHSGFKLLDFGGFYTSHGYRSGRLAMSGSLRYRPSRTSAGPLANTLYHPVKPECVREPLTDRVRAVVRLSLEAVFDAARRRPESGVLKRPAPRA